MMDILGTNALFISLNCVVLYPLIIGFIIYAIIIDSIQFG